MKVLDLTLAVGGNIFFPTSGTLNFIQLAYKEAIAASIIEEIGAGYNPNAGYILYGCVATVGASNTTITAGAIFYGGEVFLSPAQTTPNPAGSNVMVVNIVTTQYTVNADPATFSDGLHDIHNIRQAGFVAGTSGSGTMGGINFADLKTVRSIKDANIQKFVAPVVRALLGKDYDSSKFYVLFGCEQSGFDVSPGAIFYNGSVYLTSGISTGFACSGSLVLVFYFGEDYTLNLACGASGSGAIDYTGLTPLYALNWVSLTPYLSSGWAAGPGVAPALSYDFKGNVLFRGTIKATGASSTSFATLPVQYRPNYNVSKTTHAVVALTSDYVLAPVNVVAATGEMVVNAITPANNDEIYLDSVTFTTL